MRLGFLILRACDTSWVKGPSFLLESSADNRTFTYGGSPALQDRSRPTWWMVMLFADLFGWKVGSDDVVVAERMSDRCASKARLSLEIDLTLRGRD